MGRKNVKPQRTYTRRELARAWHACGRGITPGQVARFLWQQRLEAKARREARSPLAAADTKTPETFADEIHRKLDACDITPVEAIEMMRVKLQDASRPPLIEVAPLEVVGLTKRVRKATVS